jgi:thioredoxin-like negative regulator of GroEL
MNDEDPTRSGTLVKVAIVIAVIAVFAVIVGVKVGGSAAPAADGQGAAPATAAVTTTTHGRGDAIAAFEAARASGKSVFLSFGSATCPTCAEMKKVVDKVVPQYKDKVVYVSAITSDPSGQQLASRFTFQYIPTSFFIAPDGTIVDSYTGAIDEKKMRGYLDTLVAHK